MKKASRIRIRMSEDGAPRISLGEGNAAKKGVTKTKVVSFNKGRAEKAPAQPAKGRIRLRMR
ncbi:MAG: hypothetical protein ACLFWF_05500 [Alphaproteobacteria bacterium]